MLCNLSSIPQNYQFSWSSAGGETREKDNLPKNDMLVKKSVHLLQISKCPSFNSLLL